MESLVKTITYGWLFSSLPDEDAFVFLGVYEQ